MFYFKLMAVFLLLIAAMVCVYLPLYEIVDGTLANLLYGISAVLFAGVIAGFTLLWIENENKTKAVNDKIARDIENVLEEIDKTDLLIVDAKKIKEEVLSHKDQAVEGWDKYNARQDLSIAWNEQKPNPNPNPMHSGKPGFPDQTTTNQKVFSSPLGSNPHCLTGSEKPQLKDRVEGSKSKKPGVFSSSKLSRLLEYTRIWGSKAAECSSLLDEIKAIQPEVSASFTELNRRYEMERDALQQKAISLGIKVS